MDSKEKISWKIRIHVCLICLVDSLASSLLNMGHCFGIGIVMSGLRTLTMDMPWFTC